jgi:hypothetical protein
MAEKPKFDRKKIAETMRRAASKAQELGWSPNLSPEESKEAVDRPKFVSVKIGAGQPVGGFILEWQAEKVGFGEITFYVKNKQLLCDTECMGPAFVKAAMLHFLENSVIYDPKPFK